MVQSPVLLVTGASSGIGEAAARLFAAHGYRVALAARRLDRLEKLGEELRSDGGEALVVQTDVGRQDEVTRMIDSVISQFGQVDVLFNNAGFGRMDWLEALDPEGDIEAQIQVNLVGLIQTCHAVLPAMIERRSGSIINMSSMAGFIGTPTYSIYAASKFGVRGFTEALRREVAVFGIQVSGIYPGGVKNDFALKTGRPMSRMLATPGWMELTSEDVARAVLGLARRPRRVLIMPSTMKAAVWANTLFPGLVDRLIELLFVRRSRLSGS